MNEQSSNQPSDQAAAPESPVDEPEPRQSPRKRRGFFGGPLSRVIRSLKRDRRGEELRDTLEEIIESADSTREDLAPDERRLVGNILGLHDTTVADVMVPRADIIAVDMKAGLPEIIDLVKRESHSRFPIYHGTIDDMVGMLHVKDVIPYWSHRDDFAIEKIMRKVIFAAPSMPVLDLLREMRQTRLHLALVVDEYGGVDGLVTIEDLVEEIVGEIEDEHDAEAAPSMIDEAPGTVLADGRVKVEDFEARYGKFLEEDERAEVDTIGGLVFYLAQHVPVRGERVQHSSGVAFEVVDAARRRVRRVRVLHLPRQVKTGDGET